jgi:hypothetical protein
VAAPQVLVAGPEGLVAVAVGVLAAPQVLAPALLAVATPLLVMVPGAPPTLSPKPIIPRGAPPGKTWIPAARLFDVQPQSSPKRPTQNLHRRNRRIPQVGSRGKPGHCGSNICR